jgi:S-adenosylmethionine:tRNA ribosyltransferase-isomerase
MDLSLFDYPFPKELVAQHPPARREDSRMMVLDRGTQSWEHKQITGIEAYLQKGDLLVMNNALADLVDMEGKQVPALPPYIKRKKAADFTDVDFQRYRTVYGSVPGSKAAPTAGFHFTPELLQKIETLGVSTAFVTLHVDYDTYKPIRSQNILEHPMHGEKYEIPAETAEEILAAKKESRRVIAVGTTSVRAIEAWAVGTPLAASHISDAPLSGGAASSTPTTNLFISPGYQFQVVDALLTNFHRPKSTVLVMASAFAGREFILKAYEEAIREKYKLFSYGDCMLII